MIRKRYFLFSLTFHSNQKPFNVSLIYGSEMKLSVGNEKESSRFFSPTFFLFLLFWNNQSNKNISDQYFKQLWKNKYWKRFQNIIGIIIKLIFDSSNQFTNVEKNWVYILVESLRYYDIKHQSSIYCREICLFLCKIVALL